MSGNSKDHQEVGKRLVTINGTVTLVDRIVQTILTNTYGVFVQ